MTTAPANPKIVSYLPKNPNLIKARPWTDPVTGKSDDRTFFLPMGRVTFVAAAEPFASRERQQRNIKEGKAPNDGASYSLSYVIPPEADWQIVKDAASAMAKGAFGTDKVKMPWIRAEDKLEADVMGVVSLEGFWRMTANSYKGPIPVRNGRNEKLQPETYKVDNVDSPLYNGCFVIPEVRLATFDVVDDKGQKAKGIKMYLRSMQIVKNGPKLSETLSDAEGYEVVNEEDDAAMDSAFA